MSESGKLTKKSLNAKEDDGTITGNITQDVIFCNRRFDFGTMNVVKQSR